jgi:hypothetical protein
VAVRCEAASQKGWRRRGRPKRLPSTWRLVWWGALGLRSHPALLLPVVIWGLACAHVVDLIDRSMSMWRFQLFIRGSEWDLACWIQSPIDRKGFTGVRSE